MSEIYSPKFLNPRLQWSSLAVIVPTQEIQQHILPSVYSRGFSFVHLLARLQDNKNGDLRGRSQHVLLGAATNLGKDLL